MAIIRTRATLRRNTGTDNGATVAPRGLTLAEARHAMLSPGWFARYLALCNGSPGRVVEMDDAGDVTMRTETVDDLTAEAAAVIGERVENGFLVLYGRTGSIMAPSEEIPPDQTAVLDFDITTNTATVRGTRETLVDLRLFDALDTPEAVNRLAGLTLGEAWFHLVVCHHEVLSHFPQALQVAGQAVRDLMPDDSSGSRRVLPLTARAPIASLSFGDTGLPVDDAPPIRGLEKLGAAIERQRDKIVEHLRAGRLGAQGRTHPQEDPIDLPASLWAGEGLWFHPYSNRVFRITTTAPRECVEVVRDVVFRRCAVVEPLANPAEPVTNGTTVWRAVRSAVVFASRRVVVEPVANLVAPVTIGTTVRKRKPSERERIAIHLLKNHPEGGLPTTDKARRALLERELEWGQGKPGLKNTRLGVDLAKTMRPGWEP